MLDMLHLEYMHYEEVGYHMEKLVIQEAVGGLWGI